MTFVVDPPYDFPPHLSTANAALRVVGEALDAEQT
jgi:hypothetical protein